MTNVLNEEFALRVRGDKVCKCKFCYSKKCDNCKHNTSIHETICLYVGCKCDKVFNNEAA